jgi:ABC-type multidrug transport system, ATPase and permease components
MDIWKLVLADGAGALRARLLASMLLAFLHAVLHAAIPLLTVWAVHEALVAPEQGRAVWIGLAALAATLMRFPVLSAQLAKSYGVAFEAGRRLRERLLSHMRSLPLGVVRSQNSGRLVGLFNDDIKWIEAFVGGGAGLAVGALAAPLLLLLSLYWFDVALALVVTGGIVLGLPLLRLFSLFMKRSIDERTRRIDALSSRIGEHFAGMQVLRSFNAVGLADSDLKADLDALGRLYRRSALTMTPFSVFGLFVMEAALAVCAYVGVLAVSGGEIAPSTLVFVLFIGLSLYNPLLLFLAGSGQYRLAKTATGNIREFLSLPPLGSGETAAGAPTAHDLSFDDVSFRYDGKDERALEGVSFTAAHGQLTAIVGPSGAGKSTVFNLIARFWDPERGSVRIGGRDIRDIPAEGLSDLLAVVTQETVLINDTLRRNLDLGLPGIDDRRLNDAVRQARCDEFIEHLPEGLEARAGEEGVRLSGGQKQRLTIARALLKNAPVILLDEATASVDPSNARQIQEAIAALTHDRTVIVIAHRLSAVVDADKIVVMDGGRIVAQGRHQDLLASSPLYARLWADHCTSRRWTITA